ncbi:MAG: hypothetical protein JSR19_01095 [Proteobacteria bacterium]|nr:hypothetical protein [Pseudomonadota bacterium]HQR03034.1 hypothetical protein [Rhodocyclaceae bacterium]
MKALKAGTRLKSAVCDTEVMVIKVPAGEYDIRCGGAEMLDMATARDGAGSIAAGHDSGTLVGKRYVDSQEKVEMLCTKGGAGAVSINGEMLAVKQAKALPSSD